MSSVSGAIPQAGGAADILAKERIVAGPNFNRWLVPPAALCIHLCIGMAYGFSVFWLPLSKAVGITKAVDCPADMSFVASLFASTVVGVTVSVVSGGVLTVVITAAIAAAAPMLRAYDFQRSGAGAAR